MICFLLKATLPRTLLWIPVILFLACSRPPAVEPPREGEGPAPAAVTVKPQAILEPGETPLWFEFGPDGPVWIDNPGEALLTPFSPWPLSRYAAGILIRDNALTLAVNRDGFLSLLSGQDGGTAGSLAMYRAADSSYWGDYTTVALFEFRGTPTVLLYRDDFFMDSGAELPPVRVWGFEKESPRPVELLIPAFAALSTGDGWDIESLRQGRDGFWYYRGVKKEGSQREIRYLRTADLSTAGKSCSAGVFRNAVVPYTEDMVPVLLRFVLEEAGRRYGVAGTLVAEVVSPDFPIVRYFSTTVRTTEEPFAELAGYYRGSGADAAEISALAILPDGRGVLAAGDDSAPQLDLFSLPPIPEGFVYTRIGMAGQALVAAWEEQDGWNVGAAGFLVIAVHSIGVREDVKN